ncbi:MAG TPA: NADPH-dependent glutamate synthase [Candidatus Pelethomonas intestinigallinarum]|nr:NADPH-dependent glutamate synthase [Candidatus Pelethomonas intestinigallinarum]
MPNMSLKKNPMPHQDPVVRAGNFQEVALGYTREQAIDEAQRCLHCKNMPCVSGCPVQIHIPDFIAKVAEGDFEAAYQIIAQDSALPAVCGRVCPQETQCESKCVRGIKGEPVGIGRLERFVADWHNANATEKAARPASNGHRVAVIGSGPAGLTCAGDLARKGYEVTVFEALHLAGGVLVYGIPEFRLPKSIVQKEVDGLKDLGVKIETNAVVGRSITIDELMEEMKFEAVFIGSGAGLPMFMHIPGENLKGVYSANEFLTRINLMKAYREGADTPIMDLKGKKVAVVGGGNVAMDAARCSKRLGADVYIIYRRSEAELPARAEEVEHAKEEGIIFKTLTNPVEILGYNNPEDKRDPKNGSVVGIKCVEMELGEPDASGRRRPIVKEGSEFDMDMDCVIMSLGTSPNPLIKSTTKGLEINKKGGIIVNEEGLTSREGVYAGGDAVTGAATVILAMGAGKTAAKAIDEYLAKK